MKGIVKENLLEALPPAAATLARPPHYPLHSGGAAEEINETREGDGGPQQAP